jgi:hypothetical protein
VRQVVETCLMSKSVKDFPATQPLRISGSRHLNLD